MKRFEILGDLPVLHFIPRVALLPKRYKKWFLTQVLNDDVCHNTMGETYLDYLRNKEEMSAFVYETKNKAAAFLVCSTIKDRHLVQVYLDLVCSRQNVKYGVDLMGWFDWYAREIQLFHKTKVIQVLDAVGYGPFRLYRRLGYNPIYVAEHARKFLFKDAPELKPMTGKRYLNALKALQSELILDQDKMDQYPEVDVSHADGVFMIKEMPLAKSVQKSSTKPVQKSSTKPVQKSSTKSIEKPNTKKMVTGKRVKKTAKRNR
jgi:hypothetical protein